MACLKDGSLRLMNNALYTVFSIIKVIAFALTALINLTSAVSRCIMVLRTIHRNTHVPPTEEH